MADVISERRGMLSYGLKQINDTFPFDNWMNEWCQAAIYQTDCHIIDNRRKSYVKDEGAVSLKLDIIKIHLSVACLSSI